MGLIGEKLGKYEIREHLGHGGMAEVYKGYHTGLERYVAVKVLHAFLADEENFLTRFQREAKAVAGLRHPNIVQVYDFDYDEQRRIYYMVMEYIDGDSLKLCIEELASRGERMDLDEAVQIAISLGEALNYAHRQGMVHRDVKPANIMFTKENQPILTDFGIAKIVNVTGLTASGAMVGTPAYISPEQGMGQAGDERSDIYSLGVVLYQLVTGVLPFDAETSMGIVLKHINETPPSPRAIRPEVPVSLERVLLQALAKDPDQRYRAAQFVADLKRVLAGEEIEPVLLDTAVAKPSRISFDQTTPMRSAPPPPPFSPPWATPSRPAPRRSRIWLPLLMTLMAIFLLAASVLTAVGRLDWVLVGIGLPPVNPTPGPDMAATQLAATLAAMQATIGRPTDTPTPTLTPTITPTPTNTPDLTATALAACVYDMQVVTDRPVFPAVLTPGQEFAKRWQIQNTGTCVWPRSVRIVFVSGDELDVVTPPEISPLQPEETADVEIILSAPTGFKVYTSVWQLQDGAGNVIGDDLRITSRVGPTPTPRATAAPTPTPAPLVSPTPHQPLWMAVPTLVECSGVPGMYTGGQITWGYGGGPSSTYHFFKDGVSSASELGGPYYNFTGFAHIATYFVTSGEGVFWPLPAGCCTDDNGRYVTADGNEIVWRKVYIASSSCP